MKKTIQSTQNQFLLSVIAFKSSLEIQFWTTIRN